MSFCFLRILCKLKVGGKLTLATSERNAPCSAINFPKARLSRARWTIICMPRSAAPISLMQWCNLPGPSLPCKNKIKALTSFRWSFHVLHRVSLNEPKTCSYLGRNWIIKRYTMRQRRALRQFTLCTGKFASRNFPGCITILSFQMMFSYKDVLVKEIVAFSICSLFSPPQPVFPYLIKKKRKWFLHQ